MQYIAVWRNQRRHRFDARAFGLAYAVAGLSKVYNLDIGCSNESNDVMLGTDTYGTSRVIEDRFFHTAFTLGDEFFL